MSDTMYRVQNWVVILVINLFLALGAWQMTKINGTLEKLNESVIKLNGSVDNINNRLVIVDKRLDKHDEKFEHLWQQARDLYEKYTSKNK